MLVEANYAALLKLYSCYKNIGLDFQSSLNRKTGGDQVKQKKKTTFTWIMEFAGSERRLYIFSVICAVIGTICQIIPFFIIAYMIENLLSGNKNFSSYLSCFLIMSAAWLLHVVINGISTALSHSATFSVLANIRKQGLIKLEKMCLGDVKKIGDGSIKNILVERVDSIETTLAHIIPELSGNMCTVAITLILLFLIDWRMALSSLVTFPIGMACFMGMMIGYEESYKRAVNSTKNLNDTAVEYIGGIEVIKVFGKAKSSYQKFVAAAKEGADCYVEWMRKNNIYFTFSMNIMPATLIAVLPIGGILIRNGTLTVSAFIFSTILATGLINPILNCMAFSDDIAKVGTVIQEVVSIIDAKEMQRPKEDGKQVENNTICLKDVCFGYEEKEILHNINLTFKEGTVNALVGPSGSGKSTIAKLIAAFWDVKSGAVYFGGQDIRKLSLEKYYSLIAYVSQDNFLFDDTIRENIRMGNPDASDDEVEQTARECGCQDFIMELENGFDTVVGSGGDHLSGGERQRICIARAMLKNAPVVILDEATSYTDPENEALIQKSLAKLIKGKTLIVIAHRLSTIVDADQIAVVDNGSIADVGTHEELLCRCDVYKRMWNAHISSKDNLYGGVADVSDI